MSTEAVVRCLTSSEAAESVQMQMIVQSAPVLKNVKMSCMFTVPAGTSRLVCSFLYQTDIRLCRLCSSGRRDIILLYREKWMESWLNRREIAAFLSGYGYADEPLRQKLSYLGERIAYFYNQSQDFPHETGVFLGYPLEDVRGFIRHRGKGCRCTGYWKVYSDVEGAKRMFRVYDEAKACAVNEFFSGKNIREIAC
ncbi:MAG: DUF3793 family protein [Clostridiales bacterium]|nr:DUF3793 family protein [Clostridiales bacterium]